MQAGNDFQQCRLAASGRADQRNKFSVFDIEGGFRHGRKFYSARAVDFLDADKPDEGFSHAGL
jgi:hypothetical protein